LGNAACYAFTSAACSHLQSGLDTAFTSSSAGCTSDTDYSQASSAVGLVVTDRTSRQ
jgi:hypothetical protein